MLKLMLCEQAHKCDELDIEKMNQLTCIIFMKEMALNRSTQETVKKMKKKVRTRDKVTAFQIRCVDLRLSADLYRIVYSVLAGVEEYDNFSDREGRGGVVKLELL